jgi:hypothetical protein
MLVEGGYLYSMRKIIEKAAETPDPPRRDDDPRTRRPRGVLARSLKKLTALWRRDPAAR